MCQLTCILLTTCNSWTVFVVSPDRHRFSTLRPPHLLHHKVHFWPCPSRPTSLSSKYSSGEPNTSTHVTRVSTCALRYVQPFTTPINMDLFIAPLTLYFYTNTLRPLVLSRCNQMTALIELKGQNSTHKQQTYVILKRQPRKQQDGGCIFPLSSTQYIVCIVVMTYFSMLV